MARSQEGGDPVPPAPPRHVLDVFKVGSPQRDDVECVITAGINGGLHVLDARDHSALPANIQAQLSHHEMTRTQPMRRLDAVEFHIMDVDVMEQPANAPGVNDPVYLYGTLYGPLPSTPGVPIPTTLGQLTVTRADLLAAATLGAPHAFHTSSPGAVEGGGKTFHLMLPADREDVLHNGRGIVIAYLLQPGELMLEDASNASLVAQLLHDTLRAFQADMLAEHVDHPLTGEVIPVPNRRSLEMDLEAQGFVIQGNEATRRKQTKAGGIGGALINVFGALTKDRIPVPPQGSLEDFLALAQSTLAKLPGWPSGRNLALRQALAAPRVGAVSPALRTKPVVLVQPPPRVQAPASPRATTQEWVKDFAQQHPAPARITKVAKPAEFKGPSISSAPKAAWMSDFAQPADAPAPSPVVKEPAPAPSPPSGKPGWMKDFD